MVEAFLEMMGSLRSPPPEAETASSAAAAAATAEEEDQAAPFPDNCADTEMATEAVGLTAQLRLVLEALVQHPAATNLTMDLATALMQHVQGTGMQEEEEK